MIFRERNSKLRLDELKLFTKEKKSREQGSRIEETTKATKQKKGGGAS